MVKHGMYFYDKDGKLLGRDDFLPIPLYKGMLITIENEKYVVLDWSYHVEPSDGNSGLRIILQK